MRILYCASEANPFCGSGGLADVAGSLPHTLCKKRSGLQNCCSALRHNSAGT